MALHGQLAWAVTSNECDRDIGLREYRSEYVNDSFAATERQAIAVRPSETYCARTQRESLNDIDARPDTRIKEHWVLVGDLDDLR